MLPATSCLRKTLLILAGMSLPLWCADDIAGSVKTVAGTVAVVRGAQTLTAASGMHLLPNDVLRTAADGHMGAILQDGTGIGLGPNSELKIDSFIYQPANGKLSLVLRLARGVMAYFSGHISKLSPGSVKVETPVGVVGIRGTYMAISIAGSQ